MATRTIANAGGNWSSTATWVEGAVPTSSDNVVATATSGNLSIDTTNLIANSVDFTNYVGTLTWAANSSLFINGSSGTNVGFKYVTGMGITNTGSGGITFQGSATTVNIDFAGKTLPNVALIFNQTGTCVLTSAMLGAATLTHTQGTLSTNSLNHSWTSYSSNNSNVRTLTLGSSSISLSSNAPLVLNTTTNLTITTNTATITMTGTAPGPGGGGTINWNGTSFVLSAVTGAAAINMGNSTMADLTVTGTGVSATCQLNSALTITGTLTLTGAPVTNRLLVQTSAAGTQRTITAAAVSITNVDFMDINGSGAAAPWTGTSLGDAQGNSGITFDTPVDQYRIGAGGNWSDATKWSTSSGGAANGRVPLPQDNVHLDATATGTVTVDMPRVGANVDMTGWAAAASSTINVTNYGNWVMTNSTGSFSNTASNIFSGRGSQTITSNTKHFNSLNLSAPGGTYTLVDDIIGNGSFTTAAGTFDAATNNKNVTCTIVQNAAGTKTIKMGNGTWTLTGVGASSVWNLPASVTIICGNSTILISNASANTRTFAGGGSTFWNLTYTVAGSTGTLIITGANSFNTINFSDATNARTLTLPSSTTTTVTGAFNINGTAGKLMTLNASTGGTQAILKKAGGGIVSCNYLSIQDSAATVGTWYAGANSTNVSNNSGWIFAAAPSATDNQSALLLGVGD